MIEKYISRLLKTEITNENVNDIIRLSRHQCKSEERKEILQTISRNIYQLLPNLDIKNLESEEAEIIFTSEYLLLESEDSFFEYIYKGGRDFYFLFDYIEMKYLSVENVERLIELIISGEVSFHQKLWISMIGRLLVDISTIQEISENPRSIKRQNDKQNLK